jgi:hypothetical protein
MVTTPFNQTLVSKIEQLSIYNTNNIILVDGLDNFVRHYGYSILIFFSLLYNFFYFVPNFCTICDVLLLDKMTNEAYNNNELLLRLVFS